MSRQEAASREVFLFGRAPWPAIRKRLQEHKWEDEFADLNADDTAKVFEETILKILRELVPTKIISDAASSHPWLNERCRNAIDRKLDAFGTDQEVSARDHCSKFLLEEHGKYLNRTRKKLSKLPGSSKGWWRLSNALAGKRTQYNGVQPLKKDDGWARMFSEKPQLLADTFASKSL